MSIIDQEINWSPIDLVNTLDRSKTTSVFVANWRSIAFGLEMDAGKQYRIEKQNDYCFKTIFHEIVLDWISRVGTAEAKLSQLIQVLELNGCKDMSDFLRKEYFSSPEPDECSLTNTKYNETERNACISNYGTTSEIHRDAETSCQFEYSPLNPNGSISASVLERLPKWKLACCLLLLLISILVVIWVIFGTKRSNLQTFGYTELKIVPNISYKVRLFSLSEWTPGGVTVHTLDVIGCRISSNESFLDLVNVLDEFQNMQEISIDLKNNNCDTAKVIQNMAEQKENLQIKSLNIEDFKFCPVFFEEITNYISLSYLTELRIINGTVDDSNIGFIHHVLEHAEDLEILEFKVEFQTKQYFYRSSSVLQNLKAIHLLQVSMNSTVGKYVPIGDNFCEVFTRLEQLEITYGYIEHDNKDFLFRCGYLKSLIIRLQCPLNTFSGQCLEFDLPGLLHFKIFVNLSSCPNQTEITNFNQYVQSLYTDKQYETLSVCTSCDNNSSSDDNWCCIFLPTRINQYLLGFNYYIPFLNNAFNNNCSWGI